MIEISGQEIRKRNYLNSQKNVQNGLKMEMQLVNGCLQSQLNQNMFMVSSDEMAYISGNQIIIYDISTKKQHFIAREVNDLAPTAFAYTCKNMVYTFAIASQGGPDQCPYIKIFKDEKKKRFEDKKKCTKLEHTHLGLDSIILDALFLNNGKWICTLSLDQNNQSVISIYNIAKKSIMASETLDKVFQKIIATNENFEYIKAISHQKIVTLKFLQEDQIFETQVMDTSFLKENEYITDASYMIQKDRIGIVTNKNFAYYIKEDKMESKFDLSPIIIEQLKIQQQQNSHIKNQLTNEKQTLPTFQATAISGMLQGFAVGFGGTDIILALEIFEDSYFVCRKGHLHKIGYDDIHKVMNISCSDDESYLSVAVQHMNRNIKQIMKNQKEMHQIEEEHELQQSQNSNKNNNTDEVRQMSRSKNEILKKALKSIGAFGGLKATFDNTPQHLLGKIEIYTYDLQLGEIQQSDLPMEKLFGDGVQKGAIMDIAICPSFSRVLTLCEDKSLKWWEFDIKKKQPFSILQKLQFPENPLSADIHPHSLQVAIGCKECLKIYYPQEDEFKLAFAETLKTASKVKYSNSGNFLACANGNSINIYNPFNFELVKQFSSVHSGMITSLEWVDQFIQRDVYKPKELSYQDLYLVSTCNGGVVIQWNVITGYRRYEHYNGNKQIKVLAALYDPDLDLCLDCCNDGKLKFWTERGYTQFYEHNLYPMYVTCAKLYRSDMQNPTAFEIENKVAVLGTNQGTIRCYNWPIDPNSKKPEFAEILCHQKAVVSLNWTIDNSFLITGGEDGQINIIKLEEIQDGSVVANKFLQFDSYFGNVKESLDSDQQTELNMYYMNKLCMTSKYAIDAKNESIKELEFRLSNMQSDLDDEKEKQEQAKQKLIDMLKSQNILTQKELKEGSAIELEKCDTRYRELSAKRSQNEYNYLRYKERLKKLLEESLLSLYKENDYLKQQKEDINQIIIQEESQIKEEFREDTQKQEDINNQKLDQITEGWKKREQDQQMDLKKYQEVNMQNSEEQKEYLEKTKNRYEEKLSKAAKESEDLRTSYSKYQKLCEKYKMRKMELEQLINETKTQIKHLEDEQQIFFKKQGAMNSQLQSKEQIINQKESELKEFRQKNKHLKNFQNVYDFKVESLQEERAPLITHLGTVQKNIKQLYKELLDEANSQKQIDEKLEESKQMIKELKNQIKQKHDYVQITDRKVDKFKYDVNSMIKHQNFSKWNKNMKEIYTETFEGKSNISNLIKRSKLDVDSANNKLKGGEPGESISEELVRQRDFMSKKISTISRLNKQSENDRDEIVVRVQNENTHLIRECNTLREERKSLQEQLGQFENALELITKELTRLAYFEDQRQEEYQSQEYQQQLSNGKQNQQGIRYNYDILDIPEQKIQKKISVGKTAFEKYKDDKFVSQKSSKKRIGGYSMQMQNPRYLEEELKGVSHIHHSISKSQSINQIKNSNQSLINHSASIPTFMNNNISKSISSSLNQKNSDLLLNTLLKDIESYPKEMRSKQVYYDKLKEKVSSFMIQTQPSQDSTLILPQINSHVQYQNTKNIDKSQEETMLHNLQNSQITDYSSINVTQKDKI